MKETSSMSATTPGPAADLIEHAARVILASKKQPHTAPYHWAGALYQAGMLVAPGTAGPTPDILHTGRADIHHPKGPLTAQPNAEWDAEKVVTSLPGLGYDWTTIDDYNAAQAWAVEAYLAAAAEVARVRAAVAEDLRRTLAALNVALYWAHPDTPQGRDEIAGCRVALEMGQAALERLRAPSVRPDPLALCCDRLGCGHHINGHSHGSHCTHPGCGCRVWRDHVNCVHRPDTDRTPDVDTPDRPEGQRLDPDRLRVAMAEELAALRQRPAEEGSDAQ